MAKTKPKRRQRHGSAWYWKQTDCWYYTPPGSKQREALRDENGQRIRGKESKQAAGLALARIKLAAGARPKAEVEVPKAPPGPWLVARVCSEYLQYCDRQVAAERMNPDHRQSSRQYLNELCEYCGALQVAEMMKGYVSSWVDSHANWRSQVTRRNVIANILAAFNRAEKQHGVRNPLKGLKKPSSKPRLQSFSAEDEQAIYSATDEPFRNFLFAALHTGLRPFCELAKLTAEHVEETPRGMMWRVYSSKTKKTRKIPVRPEVAKLTRKLLKTAPQRSGLPLFRNTQGNAWKKVTGVGRFLAIKQTLGWDEDPVRRRYSTYTCRHTFAHRMLSGYWNDGAGCSIETLAELMGDTPKTAFDHYGREWGQHYQEPLWAAMGQAETRPLKLKRPKK
jgi:integrase